LFVLISVVSTDHLQYDKIGCLRLWLNEFAKASGMDQDMLTTVPGSGGPLAMATEFVTTVRLAT
jgi:hypothetical protein